MGLAVMGYDQLLSILKWPSHDTQMMAVELVLASNYWCLCVNNTTASWEKAGENRQVLLLSSTLCQHVVVSFIHTHQFEFGNTSWPTFVCHGKAALDYEQYLFA